MLLESRCWESMDGAGCRGVLFFRLLPVMLLGMFGIGTLAADVVDALLAVTMIRGEEEESTSMLSTGVRMSLSIDVAG